MGIFNDKNHINDVMRRYVAKSAEVASVNELKQKTNINDQTAYIMAEAFAGNPQLLLGQVIEIRKTNNKCPSSFADSKTQAFEFSPLPVMGFKIDEESRLGKPILRGSFIVNKELSMNVAFLNFLSSELDDKSSFSLMVIDQASGLVNSQDSSWKTAINNWKAENQAKMDDPDICYIYVITGFVQKNIIKKKYRQYEANTKGGAYGININGKLSTSNDEYSLDIIFGLTPAIIKRPATTDVAKDRAMDNIEPQITIVDATINELKLFASITGAKIVSAIG